MILARHLHEPEQEGATMASANDPAPQLRDVDGERREFLRRLGLTTGGLLALHVADSMGRSVMQAEAAQAIPLSSAGHFALELDGAPCGVLSSFVGGQTISRGPRRSTGPTSLTQAETMTVRCGLDLAQPWYEWITATLDGRAVRKSGAIVTLDASRKATSRLTFSDAVITEIVFPALDATLREPASMAVTLAPETLRSASPPQESPMPANKPSAQRSWLSSNFRLSIKGLEPATAKVNRIEALAVKQGKSLEFSNLTITLPQAQAAPLRAWHQDFMKGNDVHDKEKTGTLDLLAPDLKTVLATLLFSNLGILKLTSASQPARQSISRVRADMYCKGVRTKFIT
jgi:tail tube protein gp19